MIEIGPDLRIVVADCFAALRDLDEASVDAICTDPPYGINFMGKVWDGKAIEEAASKPRKLDGVERLTGDPDHPERRKMTARTGSAFANRAGEAGAYDFSIKGNRAFQIWTEGWAREAYRVLKPGGHLLSFASTRTYHRMASGVEDAGFEIRDTLAWMFGSGFPKSLDVHKAIIVRCPTGVACSGCRYCETAREQADLWRGYGTALKPAFEPIVVARKPLIGTVAANVMEHGTGALNISGCRIEFVSEDDEAESKEKNRHADFYSGPRENAVYGADERTRAEQGNYDAPGRWPANMLLGHAYGCELVGTREVDSDGRWPSERKPTAFGAHGHEKRGDDRSLTSETVETWECVPDCPVRLLDEQTGELGKSRGGRIGNAGGGTVDNVPTGAHRAGDPGFGDSGGPSRFFYVAKVSRAERNAGLDGFDPLPLHWSSGEANPGSFQSDGTDKTAKNPHPTVKPIALMRWLIRLVTPPGGLVVDPFTGSGSTGCAAALEGVRFLGIEREQEYADVAAARIRFWAEHGEETLQIVADREASERVRDAIAETGQLDLLGSA